VKELRTLRVRPGRLLVLLVLFSVLVLYGVFRSPRFQELLRRRAERLLTARIGRQVSIGRFDVTLVPPAFTIRNIAVQNDPRGLPGPCFSAEEVSLRGIPSITRDRIWLPKVRLLSPRIVFEIFEDGTSNFTTLVESLPKSKSEGVDVRLGELLLQRGTFRFRELGARLDVLLTDAGITARAEGLSRVRHLTLGCRKGRFKLEDNDVLEMAIGVEASLSPRRLHIDSLRLRSDRLNANATGGIEDLEHPVVTLVASASTSGEALAQIFGLGLPLKGEVLTAGTLRIAPGQGFRVRGRFEMPRVTFGPFPMSGSGVLRVDPSGMLLQVQRGEYAGGSLQAFVRLTRLKDAPIPIRILVDGRDLDLERFLADIDLPGTGLMARADLRSTLTFGRGGIEHADGAGELTFKTSSAPSAVRGRHALPTSGGGPMLVRDGEIRFSRLPLETAGGARLSLDGTLALGTWIPDWRLQGDFPDLTELERLAANLYPAIQKEPLTPPLQLGGSAHLEVHLDRAFGDPRVEGTFAAHDFVLRGARFGETTADFEVDHNVLTLRPFVAQDVGGSMTVTGKLAWGGKLAGHYRMEGLTSDFVRWPIERVMKFLDFDLPLTGPVTGRLPLDGVTPDLTGSVPLVWEKAGIWGQEVDRLEGVLSFEGDRLRIADTVLALGGGSARGGGVYRWDRGFQLAMELQDVPAEKLKALAESFPGITGSLRGKVTGEGTIDKPNLKVEGTLAEARLDGKAVGSPEKPVVLEATVREGVPEAHVEIADVGTLAVSGQAGRTSVKVNARSLAPLAPLLGLTEAAGLKGAVVAEVDLREGGSEGVVSSAEVELRGQKLALEGPARFRMSGGRVTLEKVTLVGVEGAAAPALGRAPARLTVSGSFGAGGGADPSAPRALDLAVNGTFDASLLKTVLPEGDLAGGVAVDLKVSGTTARPVFSGGLSLGGVDYSASADSPAVVGLTGAVALSSGRVSADSLTFGFLGGSVDAGGTLLLDGSQVTSVRLNAHLNRVRAQPFEGMRATVSGDIVLTGAQTLRTARGELVLERAIYDAPFELSITSLLGRRAPASLPPPPGSFDAVVLDVRITAPAGSVEIRNNVARARLSGELSARGTWGHPILFGQLEAEEGGRLTFQDLRYELLSARLLFSNPQRIDPYFELEARTQVKEYQIDVGLSGTMSRLVPRFNADPALSEAQIVSLLATGELPGNTPAGVPVGRPPVSNDRAVAEAARSLIASLAAEAVTSRTKQLFRLDRLQFDPALGSTTSSPRLTIGKTIARDLTVTYSYTTAQREAIIAVEYQLSTNTFLQAVKDDNGVYSVDLKLRQRLR